MLKIVSGTGSVVSHASLNKSRRDQLIDEGIRSFNARGISQTSLADIAKKLGISRAALYYHVEDRQDLVFQCYRTSCERLAAYLAHAGRVGVSESEIVKGFILSALSPTAQNFASINEIGYLTPEQQDTIFGIYDGIVAQLASHIASATQSGEYRACDPVIVAQTLLSVIFWTPMAQSWSEQVYAAAQGPTVEALVDLLDRGLLDRTASSPQIVPVDFSGFLPVSAGPFDKTFVTRTRQEALLQAASWLFNRKGVDATSLNEIAARAGTTKRAILHHFGDKQRLVEATYIRGLRLSLYISEQLAEARLPPDVRLASAFGALCKAAMRDDLSLATPRLGLHAFDPSARAELEELSDRLTQHYVDLLRTGQREAIVLEVDVLGYTAMAAGAFHWLHHGLGDAKKHDEDQVAHEVSKLLLQGLSAH